MQRLVGNMGIGHVRYPTAGSSNSAEAQPMYVNSPYGITLAHNGNLTNSEQLKRDVYREDLRHVNTESDSEVLLNVFAHELQRVAGHRPEPEHIFEAVAGVHQRCRGAYRGGGDGDRRRHRRLSRQVRHSPAGVRQSARRSPAPTT